MKRQHGLLERIIQWGKAPLVVETVQKSITVGGNTGAAGTADLSKSGYTPVAVVGIQIAGDASGSAEIRQWRLNGNQAYTYVWNHNSASKTWTLTFHILWLKTLGGGYCVAVFSRLATIFSLVRGWRYEQTKQHFEQTMHSGGCNSIKYKFIYFRQFRLHSKRPFGQAVWQDDDNILHRGKKHRVSCWSHYVYRHHYERISSCRDIGRSKRDFQRIDRGGRDCICTTSNECWSRFERRLRHDVYARINTISERGCVV